MSRRVWLPSNKRDVEENMHTMDIRINIKTMIQTTLSPSILSKKFQTVRFFPDMC